MRQIAKSLYKKIKSAYGQSIVDLETIQQDILGLVKTPENPDGFISAEDQADYAFALRECEELLDRMIKNVRKAKNMASKSACITCFSDMIDKITTDHCTAVPREKFAFQYPSKRRYDPETYDTLMEALGIPLDVYGRELVRLHWPNFQAYCNELTSAGHPIPAGLDPNKQISEYDLQIRRKSGIQIDDEEKVLDPEECNDTPF